MGARRASLQAPLSPHPNPLPSGARAPYRKPAARWGQGMTTLLGDARTGKLADNLTAFGRTLRRAGVSVDAARIALAQQALQLTGVEAKRDVAAALEAVLVGREQDRAVFRELFDAFFRDPDRG